MAKTSAVQKNLKRIKLVKKFAKKRAALKTIINNKNSIYKSEVKMILALHNYILPIVSDSHAYSACAKSLNAEFLVFNKDIAPFDILFKIDCKDNEFFDNFFKDSIQYIDKYFNSNAIADKLFKLVNNKYIN